MDQLKTILAAIDNIGIDHEAIRAIYLGCELSVIISYAEFLRLFTGQTCETKHTGEWEHVSIKQGNVTVSACRPTYTTPTTTTVLQ